MSQVSAFAPASVSNVTCGFDILGFAVEGPGDQVTAATIDRPGVEIESIEGDDGRLPREPALNTAGIAAATNGLIQIRINICLTHALIVAFCSAYVQLLLRPPKLCSKIRSILCASAQFPTIKKSEL